MNIDFLRNEERIALELKSLYKSYGYSEYRLPGFEEYSLYAENVSFLADKDVIAFNCGGKLLALRPDVTLSIVKSVDAKFTRKLFYDEKVYRKTAHGGFAEVSQVGVEIIGGVDRVARAEIIALMLGSLERVGGKYVIEAAHVGVTVKALGFTGLRDKDRAFALECLRGKNVHDFAEFARAKGVGAEAAEVFKSLIDLPPEPLRAIESLKKLEAYVDINEELRELEELYALSQGNISFDFSIFGDEEYYNGLIFKGYVDGIPHAVLSGGRYDKLLKKFGKNAEAVGFALYLGELGRYLEEKPDMPEAVVLYGDEENALKIAENLRSRGKNTLVCRDLPEGFTGEIITAEENS